MTLRAIQTMLLFFCFSSTGFASEQVFFYHTDPAGTPLSMTDSNGSVVWKADYKPFGEEYAVTGSAANDKRFVGKEKDEETGLSYFGARYEDAKIGRFTAVDPVKAVDPMTGKTNERLLLNPQRLNVYAYGMNNPYRYIDPDGKEPVLRELMSKVVSSEAFIRFGEAIGASRLNAALTGYDFRGNEFTGFERVEQLGVALSSVPVTSVKNPASVEKGLGSPFKGKTSSEIDAMLRAKGFEPRGPEPQNGLGGYVNPKTGRSYHIDESNSFGESPHVDVNRVKSYNGSLQKKKLSMGD